MCGIIKWLEFSALGFWLLASSLLVRDACVTHPPG
jgi:hypothetical protein